MSDTARLDDSATSDAAVLAYLKQTAVEKLNMRPEQVAALRLETPLVEGLQLDSLQQVVLLADFEDHFGFELDAEAQDGLAQLVTVGDLVTFIRARAARKA